MLSHATARRPSAPTPSELLDRIEVLEEENRELRALLSPSATLPLDWKLTRPMVRAVTILARARGKVVTQARLMNGVFGYDTDHLPNHLYVIFSKIRQGEARHGLKICARYGFGYYMPAEICERVLAHLD